MSRKTFVAIAIIVLTMFSSSPSFSAGMTETDFQMRADDIYVGKRNQLTSYLESKFGAISSYRDFATAPKYPIFTAGDDIANETGLNVFEGNVNTWYENEINNIDTSRITLASAVSSTSGGKQTNPNELTQEAFQSQLAQDREKYKNSFDAMVKQRFDDLSYAYYAPLPIFPEFIFGDNAGNRKKLESYQSQINSWYGAETKYLSESRVEPPASLLSPIPIDTAEKFSAVVNRVLNSKERQALWEETNKLYGDNGFSWVRPSPLVPQFDVANPELNARVLAVWEYLDTKWAIWQKDNLNPANVIISEPVPVDPNEWIRQCDFQSSANIRSFNGFREAINAIAQLIRNESVNSDSAEKADNFKALEEKLSDLKDGANIYLIKLPVYLEREPRCAIYKDQIQEVREIIVSADSVLKSLRIAKSKPLVKPTSFNQNAFDATLPTVESKISKAQIIPIATPQALAKVDKRLPIACSRVKDKARLTVDGTKCPPGYKKR